MDNHNTAVHNGTMSLCALKEENLASAAEYPSLGIKAALRGTEQAGSLMFALVFQSAYCPVFDCKNDEKFVFVVYESSFFGGLPQPTDRHMASAICKELCSLKNA